GSGRTFAYCSQRRSGWSLIELCAVPLAKDLQMDKSMKVQLSARFRKERASLESIIGLAKSDDDPLSPGFEALRRRSVRLAPIVAELKATERAGKLSASITDLALSFVHMHTNRMLRSAHREQEFLIYDFLGRLYESQVGRPRGRSRRASP